MPRPIQPKLNKDHWGFYKVGDYKTYSWLEAVEISGKTNQPLSWNFNNEVFSNFDWSKEPLGSLEFWYKQRAEQLRNYYDYIILMYSGGWDCDNILRTFVDNNIFIDEIVHTTTYYGHNGDLDAPANREPTVCAIPRIKNLIETNPTYKNTKQTIVDITDHEKRFLKESVSGFDYFYTTALLLTPALNVHTHVVEWESKIANVYNQYKRVGTIYGLEKPKVWMNEIGDINVAFTQFPGLAYHHTAEQIENKEWKHDEMFYYTPDMPEVTCKQAHVLARYLKTLTTENIDPAHHNITPYQWNQGLNYWGSAQKRENNLLITVDDDRVTDLIYPNKRINVGEKAISLFFGVRDKWIWDNQSPDLGQSKYLKGLAWFKQTVKKYRPDLWWEKPGSFEAGKLPTGGIVPNQNLYSVVKGKT